MEGVQSELITAFLPNQIDYVHPAQDGDVPGLYWTLRRLAAWENTRGPLLPRASTQMTDSTSLRRTLHACRGVPTSNPNSNGTCYGFDRTLFLTSCKAASCRIIAFCWFAICSSCCFCCIIACTRPPKINQMHRTTQPAGTFLNYTSSAGLGQHPDSRSSRIHWRVNRHLVSPPTNRNPTVC